MVQHARLLEPVPAGQTQFDEAWEPCDPFAESGERKAWDFPFAPPPLGPEDLATRALPRFFGSGSSRRPLASAAAA